MTLPSAGNTISFGQLQTEFGGSNPISMNEYGDKIGLTVGTTSTHDMADFYGLSNNLGTIGITPGSRFVGKANRRHHGYESSPANGSIQTSTPVSMNGATITPTQMKWVDVIGWRFQATINSGTWNTTAWTKFRIIDDNDDESDVNLERSTVTSQSVVGSQLVIVWPSEDQYVYGGTVTWELT